MDDTADLYSTVQKKTMSASPHQPAAEGAYEMDDMEDLYANVQEKTIPAPPNQAAAEEPHSAAQDVTDECEYNNLNSNKGIPHNNDASTSRTTTIELTDVKKDKKFNLINPAMILAFVSLLVGIVAISLVFVFDNKEAFLGFEQQLEKITTTINLLKLEQNKSSMNLEALHAVENRTTDLEKYKKNNQRQFKQLPTKEETNKLNKTLVGVQKSITDILEANSKTKMILQKQQNLINSTIKTLLLEQSKSSMNLEALHSVENRTTDLEKYKRNNQRQFNQLTTKEEANELNKTLMALQNKITDIENKNSAKDMKLNEQQNLINLLLQSSSLTHGRKWLTLSNGYEYRRTKNKTKLWRDARDECQSYGRGRLASVGMRDATVRTFLMLHFLPKSNEYWIGLRANTTFNWYWIDNTERGEDENAIWFDGEPTTTNNERCAVLSMRTSAIGANSVRCNNMTTTYYGICERKV